MDGDVRRQPAEPVRGGGGGAERGGGWGDVCAGEGRDGGFLGAEWAEACAISRLSLFQAGAAGRSVVVVWAVFVRGR